MTPSADGRGRYDRTLSQRARRRATRGRVLEAAALRLLAEPGAELNLAALARDARISRRTLYQLFGDGLRLTRLVTRFAERLGSGVLAEAAREAVTPMTRLRELALAWRRLSADDRPCARLAAELACLPQGERMRALLFRHLLRALSDAHRDGLLGRRPSPLTVELLVGAWAVAGGRVAAGRPPEVVAQRLADLALQAGRGA